MKHADWFSGIGAFALASKELGNQIVSVSEIDPHANKVLDHHIGAPNLGDIRNVQAANPIFHRGGIDIFTGGFPCQDISRAGKMQGLSGERSGLWFEFARLIEAIKPRWVVIENVPNLLHTNKGRDMLEIIRFLDGIGYGISWRVVDARHFGLAQQRRRLFIVGSLGSQRAADALLQTENVSRHFGSGATLERQHPPGVVDNHRITSTLTATAGARRIISSWFMSSPFAVQDGKVRHLTTTEWERLQGFPDGYTDVGISEAQRRKALGNAVALPVARWLMERIVKA